MCNKQKVKNLVKLKKESDLLKSKYCKYIQDALFFILFLHKFFAILPFNLSNYRFQKFSFILSSFVIYAIIYTCLMMLNIDKLLNESKAYIFKLIPIILSWGQIIFSALLLCICHLKSINLNSKLKVIVIRLVQIDKILTEKLNIQINYKFMRNKVFAITFLQCVVSHIVNLYLFFKLDEKLPKVILTLFYMPNIYEKLYKVIYIVLVDLLRQRIRYLNKYFKHHFYTNQEEFLKFQVNSETAVYQYGGLHYIQKLNKIKLTNSDLRDVLIIHNKITETGKLINKAYGMQVLVGFIITFIVLVSMLFYFPVGILAHLNGKSHLFFSFAHLYWAFLKTLLCVWFTKVITECQQEVERTSTIGYDLLIDDIDPYLTDQIAMEKAPETSFVYDVLHWVGRTIKASCVCCSPCLVSLLSSRRNKYRLCKSFLWFVFGIAVSLFIYQLFLVDLGLDISKTYFLALVMGTSITFGNMVSRQIRTITLLSLSTFLGKSGQSALKALVLSFIVAGPIQNLADNTEEVVRVFACTTSLTYNMTKTRYELIFKPFSDALLRMKADTSDLKDSLNSVRDIVEPIRKELQEEGESKYLKEQNDYLDELEEMVGGGETKVTDNTPLTGDQVENKYMQKLEYRCQGMVHRASSKCTASFKRVYDTCMKNMYAVVSWFLCSPMKLTFICNLGSSLGDTCKPRETIGPGFGKGYVTLNETQAQMQSQFKDVKMQYKFSKFFKVPSNVQDMFDSSSEVMATFSEKKNTADFVLWMLVKWILAFSFIRIVWKAEKYLRLYLTNIEFDNVYITDYFRKIDNRRLSQQKQTILPLKAVEKRKFVDPYSLVISWTTIFPPTMKLFLEMIPATTFILLDRLFYESLNLIRRHSYIEYTQVGHHDLSFKVKGTGLIASLIRSVIKGFNVKKRVKIERTNIECLPHPKLLPTSVIYQVYGTFALVLLMILFNGYLKRIRHICCALLFRKHEKRRVLYLYNETLRRRKQFFKYMKVKVNKIVKENKLVEDMNFLLMLRLKFPRVFNWLYILSVARRKCLICRDVEKRDWPIISCENCPYVFCQDCWDLIEHNCYICQPFPEVDEDDIHDETGSERSELD